MTTPLIDALAREPVDDLDQAILLAVGAVQARADPIPAGLTGRIHFELSLRAMRAELAQIQSKVQLETVRSDAVPEMFDTMSFSASQVSLMVVFAEAPPRDDAVRIDAWVTMPEVRVELWQDGQMTPAQADRDGRLAWNDVPRRPTRFLIPGNPPVVTPTVSF